MNDNKDLTKSKLANKIQEFKEQLLNDKDCDIRCLVFSVLEKDNNFPIVLYAGDKVECAALTGAVHKELVDRVVNIMENK